MNVLSVIFVIQVVIQIAKCQGGGGPSTFGYDASSACSRPYSRAGRARLANLPCDFRRQNWCTVAGSSYPWHAVRRFVQENQGLMRRMYGDESHINVLRAEFDKNEIELKYDDYYYHPFDDDHRRYQYVDEYDDYHEDREGSKSSNPETSGRGFTSRSLNDPSTKRTHKFPKLSEYTRPHFRPTEKTTTTTKRATTTKPTTIISTTASTISSSTNTETPSTTSSTTSTTVLTTQESTTKQLTSSTFPRTTNEDKTDSTSTEEIPVATVSEIVKEQNFSINEIPGQIDRIDEDLDENVANEAVSEEILEELTTETLPGMNDEDVDAVVEDDLFGSGKETTIHETYSPSEQQFRPRPEYKPGNRPQTSSMEGQLYQDVAAKDQQEQPVLKLRGVNACPVKEEVVAPFWANNTRGEVLALLNLYPFEQYVHWEKCTHENKQMYCRDGCRCEQQYRLHRLLAYDPNNECRGIFSDWFKFPSCCVCRCYDLPLEFRVTSRSPRAQRQKIKVRLPRNRFS